MLCFYLLRWDHLIFLPFQASKELEAVTQLHTLTNSHRSVKVIKKPRSARTKHVTGRSDFQSFGWQFICKICSFVLYISCYTLEHLIEHNLEDRHRGLR